MQKRLAADNVAPHVQSDMAEFHRGVVDEVEKTVAEKPVVVVGMAQNPVVKKARRILDDAGIAYEYLEYGSYLSQWKPRLAIKMWAGFPTFPMVFMGGKLVGGAADLEKLREKGELKAP